MDIISVSVLLLLVCFITWIFHSLFMTENIFRDAEVPHASKFASLIGIKNIFIQPFKEIVLQSYMKNGKIYGQYVFGRPQLTVGDPDLIRQVLVKDFQFFVDRMDTITGDPLFDKSVTVLTGADWKRVRTVLSPSFSTGKIRRMTDTILDCAETLRKNLETIVSAGELVDMKRFFGTFTMDAIVSTAFGSKIDSHNDPDNPFVVAARNVFTKSTQLRLILFVFFNHVTRILRMKASDIFGSEFFGKVTKKLIENRRGSAEVRNDFLQLLLDAREKNNSHVTDDTKREHDIDVDTLEDDVQTSSTNGDITSLGGKGITEDELVATCITFFIGGYETVASTLAFAAYELALNEECQKTLIAEIDELLARERKLTYENVQSLKYLDAVVSETLRRYPPLPSLTRMTTTDCMLGDIMNVPKGTMIAIPVYALHHDPEYYPEPDKFLPSRFFPEEKSSRNPYVYLPFGAGQRNCIATRFALIEVKLCLAHLLRNFTFHRSERTQVPLKFPSVQVQLVAPEIILRIKMRNSHPMNDS